MRCLTDVELQSLADGEGGGADGAHAMSCAICRAKLQDRHRQIKRLTMLADEDVPMPLALEERVMRAVTAAPVRGATALRPAAPRSLRPLWLSGLGAVAAAAVVIMVVLPRVDAPATLSASQIIGRSLERMTTGQGVEILEYELVLASALRGARGLSDGPYRIIQMFDRRNPQRYRFAELDRDGVLQAAAAQDPARGRRSELIRVDGRNYIVHVASPEPLPSLPEILQAQAESVLKTMQVTAGDHVSVEEGPDGKVYVIEMPPLASVTGGVPLDLRYARVVIDGGDFRVREFAAGGVLFKQPFDLSFKLIRQEKAAAVGADDWEIPVADGDVVIEGEGAGRLDDVMTIVLRELGKTQGR